MENNIANKKYKKSLNRPDGGVEITFDEVLIFLRVYFKSKSMANAADEIGINQTTFFYWKREDSIEKLIYAINNAGLGLEFVRYLRDTESTFNIKTKFAKVASNGEVLEKYKNELDEKKLNEYKNLQKIINNYRGILKEAVAAEIRLGYKELVEIEKLLDYALYYSSEKIYIDLLKDLGEIIKKYHTDCTTLYVRNILRLISEDGKSFEEATDIVSSEVKDGVAKKRMEITENGKLLL